MPRELEILQDVQHLEQHHATARRLVGRDLVAAIVAPQRRVFNRLPRLQVFDRQERLVLLHVVGDRLGDLAGIEDVGAALGDGAQGLAVVAVDDAVAHPLGRAVGPAIERARRVSEAGALVIGRAAEGAVVGPPVVDVRPHRPAALRPGDGRLDDARPRQAAVLLVRLVVHFQVGRRADRLVADVVHPALQDEAVAVARLALDQVGPHVGPRAERRRRMGVDVAVELLARHVDAATAEAGDAAHQRIDHALDQRAGDAGIDGIAAFAQDIGAGLGGLGLRGDDHRLLRVTHVWFLLVFRLVVLSIPPPPAREAASEGTFATLWRD